MAQCVWRRRVRLPLGRPRRPRHAPGAQL